VKGHDLMSIAAKLRRSPGRLAAGAFVLNAGIGKWSADEETAARLHGMADGTYPFLAKIKPADFTKLLAAGEIAIGTALLLPVVPAGPAGLALTGFSGGLLGLYLKTPGMRVGRTVRPSRPGTALAKDVWMLAIGLSLVLDALTDHQTKPS
jgi:hypothetical protein